MITIRYCNSYTGCEQKNRPPTKFASSIIFFLTFLKIFSCHWVKLYKTKFFVLSWEDSVVNFMLSGFILDLKLNNYISSAFLYFFHYSKAICPNSILFLFADEKSNILHLIHYQEAIQVTLQSSTDLVNQLVSGK